MKAVENAVNEAKVYSYLSKPWDDQMLESVINSAVDFKAKEDERLRLIDEIACKKKN
jgi:response regulator RpfG family c-di-GMP phosphodiesterase